VYRSRGITPLNLSLSSRWRLAVNITPRPLWDQFKRSLGGTLSPSGRVGVRIQTACRPSVQPAHDSVRGSDLCRSWLRVTFSLLNASLRHNSDGPVRSTGARPDCSRTHCRPVHRLHSFCGICGGQSGILIVYRYTLVRIIQTALHSHTQCGRHPC
jgi:hypothetical protein